MADDGLVGEGSQPELSFDACIHRINQPEARELVKKINLFMRDLRAKAPDADSDSRAFQDFMASMERAFGAHPLWAGCTHAELDASVEGLEKYLITKLFDRTFGQDLMDRERDSALAARLAALQFVQPHHLEMSQEYASDGTLAIAQKELKKINMHKCPRDKLGCVLSCCRVINNLLASRKHGAGADDLTPVLIYVAIKASPEYLASNLAFIERYRTASRLVSEAMYFFVQMQGAAAFIETLTTTSLKVDPDELLAHMLAAGALSDAELEMMAQQAQATPGQGQQAQGQGQQAAQGGRDAAAAVAEAAAQMEERRQAQQDLMIWGDDDPATAAATAAVDVAGAAHALHQTPPQQQQRPRAAPDLLSDLTWGAADELSPSPAGPLPSRTASGAEAAPVGVLPGATGAQAGSHAAAAPISGAFTHAHVEWPPRPPGMPSSAELEAEGVGLVLQAEAAGELADRHRFLYASFEGLTIADVRALLQAYKELALKYEAVALAADGATSASRAGAAGAAHEADTAAPAATQRPAPGASSAAAAPTAAAGAAATAVPAASTSASAATAAAASSSAASNEPRPEAPDDGAAGPPYSCHVVSPWFEHLASGTKDVEGRLGQGLFSRLAPGDGLAFVGGSDGRGQLATEVVAVRRYASFEEYLTAEGLRRTLPGLVGSMADGVAVYRAFYSAEDERRHGVAAVQVKRLLPVHPDSAGSAPV